MQACVDTLGPKGSSQTWQLTNLVIHRQQVPANCRVLVTQLKCICQSAPPELNAERSQCIVESCKCGCWRWTLLASSRKPERRWPDLDIPIEHFTSCQPQVSANAHRTSVPNAQESCVEPSFVTRARTERTELAGALRASILTVLTVTRSLYWAPFQAHCRCPE